MVHQRGLRYGVNMNNRELILMVGPQGSGKSHYCNNNLKDYYRISQDVMGKRGHYFRFLSLLSSGINYLDGLDKIVVDRCGFDKVQRVRYIIPAKYLGYRIKVIHLLATRPQCEANIRNRKDHPTLGVNKMKQALDMYFSKFQPPTLDEGIDEIVEVSVNYVGVL